MKLRYAENNPDRLDYFLSRRSTPVKLLGGAGPTADELALILRAGARVPDHGKLHPWFFIVFQGDARADIGNRIADLYRSKNPDAPNEAVQVERDRFLRAPLVICVVSRPRPSKIPHWEQVLSAGAACHALSLAANAVGYGSIWLTEWLAFDDGVKGILGLDDRDTIAGFIYIGTPSAPPEERDRPDLTQITTHWTGAPVTAKGDLYNKE